MILLLLIFDAQAVDVEEFRDLANSADREYHPVCEGHAEDERGGDPLRDVLALPIHGKAEEPDQEGPRID